MPEIRRKHDREFREGAVTIVRETGRAIVEVASDLGIGAGTLGNWVKKDRLARGEESDLVRWTGDQLGLLARRTGALAAPFRFSPATASSRYMGWRSGTVDAVIEQAGPHLRPGQVAVFVRAQHRQHPLAFLLGDRVRRGRPGRRRARHWWAAPPVARRTRTPNRSHAALVDVTASGSPKCASIIASTSDRCPRSRRVLPSGRAVSHHIERRSRLGQLSRQAFAAAPEALQLDPLGGSLRLRLRRQALTGAAIAGLAPLRQMGAVQAFPTQQGATLGRTDRERVVLVEDLGLVIGGG